MGGEFFMYMQSRPTAIPEDAARFYAAAVVLGLEYMQRHDLVWRWPPPPPSFLHLSSALPVDLPAAPEGKLNVVQYTCSKTQAAERVFTATRAASGKRLQFAASLEVCLATKLFCPEMLRIREPCEN